MDPTKRILLNTVVQYSRSVLNILLSLFSTRYILQALGNSDYGVFVLVGGIVSMLGFVTNALVITTQRYISYYWGKKKVYMVKKIFANSLCVHASVSFLLLVILFMLRDVVVYNFLNIPADRIVAACKTYDITVFLLVVTIMSAPYKALFIAHENITYISLVEVLDGFIKLAAALFVLAASVDKLILYAVLMLAIQVFNIGALAIYAVIKYEEAKVLAVYRYVDKKCMQQLIGFAGWSTYGMGAIVLRNQGIQWLLNTSFSTMINAAYGIAMQVYGSISFVSTSVLNAMNPQIMKAEGEGNRDMMLFLSEMASKYSTILLSLIVIPLIMEMPSILSFWLSDVPEGADMFCRIILIGFIADQSTYGLNVTSQAIGRIKVYTLLMYTPKLLVIVPVFFLLRDGATPFCVMLLYLGVEVLVSFMRIPYIKYMCGLEIGKYMKDVILPLLPLVVFEMTIGYFCVKVIDMPFRFLLTVPLSMVFGCFVTWKFSLTKREKDYVCSLVRRNVKE